MFKTVSSAPVVSYSPYVDLSFSLFVHSSSSTSCGLELALSLRESQIGRVQLRVQTDRQTDGPAHFSHLALPPLLIWATSAWQEGGRTAVKQLEPLREAN